MFVMKILSNAKNRIRVNEYLAEFDLDWQPKGYKGHRVGKLETTFFKHEAMQFETAEDVMTFWNMQSKKHPLRPDGQPNKPLTAYNIEVIELDNEQSNGS